jgi:hypothetical protein
MPVVQNPNRARGVPSATPDDIRSDVPNGSNRHLLVRSELDPCAIRSKT